MPTILLALPFGQNTRDILRTDIFEVLAATADIELVILTQAAEQEEFLQEFSRPNVRFELLHSYKPRRTESLARTFYMTTLRNRSSTFRMFAQRGSSSRGFRTLAPVADLSIRLLGEQRVKSILNSIMLGRVPIKEYDDLFDRYQPDLVVVTRVVGWSADYPILKQAAQRKVPAVAVAGSWDNFTSKGFYPFGIDSLVVWNDIMRQEARDLFGFPDEDIFISGIPRFDLFFRRTGFRSRSHFFADLELDPQKPLITYTTGNRDLLVGPQDPVSPELELVEFLADVVTSGQLGTPGQLLVRLHPLGDPNVFARLAQRTGVTLQVPGKTSVFKDRLFSRADDVELGETMLYSDVVLNIASTITIDAAVFDTPTVCLDFDFRGERPYIHSVRRFYDFEHYRKLSKAGGFRLANSRQSTVEEIKAYLADPSRDQDGRRRIVQQQCHFDDGKSGERVARHILRLVGIKKEGLVLT